ncbi:FemB, factor involved in methicillin resistance / Glycine interpeptide bridge formation [Staphylococcus aureus]|uniref:FemB, factor involved in methicillin resistance / Glycine interpeptide bridge formation n=1 Tax=Staphylococcus aureus TaxID=1280 RepID=A0A380EJQ9_STAAU|nr:FemB, factor involved in methicillin resistance / Glycine interpeptide bridge formation [Staphylococcus aureus]
MGSYVYYSNRGPVMDFSDLGLVDYYLKELDKYLQQHQCLYVKLDPYWLYHLYDKDIVPFEGREKNDALVNCLNHMVTSIMALQLSMIHRAKYDGWAY